VKIATSSGSALRSPALSAILGELWATTPPLRGTPPREGNLCCWGNLALIDETVRIMPISTKGFKRLIAVSDIHGELDLFKRLLDKVGFCDSDALVLLGDLYLKGSRELECLRFIIDLDKRANVF